VERKKFRVWVVVSELLHRAEDDEWDTWYRSRWFCKRGQEKKNVGPISCLFDSSRRRGCDSCLGLYNKSSIEKRKKKTAGTRTTKRFYFSRYFCVPLYLI